MNDKVHSSDNMYIQLCYDGPRAKNDKRAMKLVALSKKGDNTFSEKGIDQTVSCVRATRPKEDFML